MSLHTLLLFFSASLVLCIVPGPDMMFLLGRTVAQGRKAGLCAAFGINLGSYFHLVAAATGLSAVILASSTAFTIVKWMGAAYLFYLGFGALRARSDIAAPSVDRSTATLRQVFWQGFLSDVLNPKVALFFVALLPQFIDAADPHPVIHLLELGVVGNVVGISTSVFYVLVATGLTGALRRRPTISTWLHKGMGALFIALGVKLASEKI